MASKLNQHEGLIHRPLADRKLKYSPHPTPETNSMTRIEAFRLAIQEIGDVSAEELSSFIQRKFGIRISVPYIPVFRATLRAQQVAVGPERVKELSNHSVEPRIDFRVGDGVPNCSPS